MTSSKFRSRLKTIQMRQRPTRRQVLMSAIGAATGVAMPFAVPRALADDTQWYSGLFENEHSDKTAQVARRKIPNTDLNLSSIPLASTDMLARLDHTIGRHRRIVRNGGWPKLKRLRFLPSGSRHSSVPHIRQQLALMGDIKPRASSWFRDDATVDAEFNQGLKRFQRRHGLQPSGRLDRATRYHLGISAEDRLTQLLVNRRRVAELLRSLPSGRHVLVNIPAYQLEAVSNGKIELRHTAIVGRNNRQTPDISATITSINLLPFWRVPQSIAKRDIIPRARRNAGFLKEQHFRVAKGSFDGPEIDVNTIDWSSASLADLRFRQNPGPWNALGHVRINMPNKDIIYLHDTPMKHLFKQRHRAFSAGCIRVHDVMKLVSWIGQHNDSLKSSSHVEQTIKMHAPSSVRHKRPKGLDIQLAEPVPVRLAYLTAWVEDNGEVIFRTDIYRRDPTRANTRNPATARQRLVKPQRLVKIMSP